MALLAVTENRYLLPEVRLVAVYEVAVPSWSPTSVIVSVRLPESMYTE